MSRRPDRAEETEPQEGDVIEAEGDDETRFDLAEEVGDFEQSPGIEDGAPIRRVFGSSRNLAEYGAPSEFEGEERLAYYFYPTWRSQLGSLFLFAITSIVVVILSNTELIGEFTVLPGKLFEIGGTTYFLHLPLLVFIPSYVLVRILFSVYNSRYIIDASGVEAQVGLVSLYLRQPRLRYEDIRGVEPEQSLVERILGIGRVLVGSAMTADVEIVMEGVSNPRAIQLLINRERDNSLHQIRASGMDKVAIFNGE